MKTQKCRFILLPYFEIITKILIDFDFVDAPTSKLLTEVGTTSNNKCLY